LKLGREICERELKNNNTTIKKIIKSGHIRMLLKVLRCNSLEDMLIKVGSGIITVNNLVKALQPPELQQEKEQAGPELPPAQLAALLVSQSSEKEPGKSGISIDGIDGMLVKISQCCSPVPGDTIVGFITTGRGVSVHKADCVNLLSTDPQRWIKVSWAGLEDRHYKAGVHVSAENRRGIFAEISSAISADNANILEVSAHVTPADTADLTISLEVANLEHLQQLMQHLRQMEHVISVRRL
jgi:guanosine-3',5'-bis(diphosphate) 3'-pyrophosphohydrolase